MKTSLNRRQRLLAIVAGAGVLLLFLDRLVFTPLTDTWNAHAAEIVRLQQTVAAGRGSILRAAQTQRVWSEMETNALPKDPALAEQELLAAFDTWGRANNVELGSIRPQWKRGTTDRYSVLECRVDASGSLTTLTHFLYELERSPLPLRVDSVELTSRDDGGQRLNLALVVSGLRLAPLERKL